MANDFDYAVYVAAQQDEYRDEGAEELRKELLRIIDERINWATNEGAVELHWFKSELKKAQRI